MASDNPELEASYIAAIQALQKGKYQIEIALRILTNKLFALQKEQTK